MADTDTDTDDVERAPCKVCREKISTEATRCPECGHEPGSRSTAQQVGGLLFMLIFGALAWLIHPLLSLAVVGVYVLLAGTVAFINVFRDPRPTTHKR